MLVIEPGGESPPEPIRACKRNGSPRPLVPGLYEVIKTIAFAPSGADVSASGSVIFEVAP